MCGEHENMEDKNLKKGTTFIETAKVRISTTTAFRSGQELRLSYI